MLHTDSRLCTKTVTSTTVPATANGILVVGTNTCTGLLRKREFINLGSVVVTLYPDNTLTAGTGITLATVGTAGSTYTDDASTDSWFAIAASSTATLKTIFYNVNYGSNQTVGVGG